MDRMTGRLSSEGAGGEDGVFAMEQAYLTREEPYFEAHQRYIDVQYILEGCESMWCVNQHPDGA